MGSSYKKAIFEEHVQAGLVGWAEKVKRKKGLKAAAAAAAAKEGPNQSSSHDSSLGIQLGRIGRNGSAPQEIQPSAGSEGQT